MGCLAALAIGCGQGDEGDAEEAGKGWRAASAAIAGGAQEFEASVEVGEDGSIDATCPEGGSIAVEGTFDSEDTFAFSVRFEGCKSQGVTMNGELAMSAVVETTPSSTEVRFDYVGQVEFTGAVELSCDIDVTGRVAASASETMATAEAEFEGSVCGVDAEAAIRASS